MKKLSDEIKLTLDLMQTDSAVAREELQFHLYSLLDMKRDVLRQRLVERSLAETDKPLTTEELLEGGWWCADRAILVETDALKSKHLQVLHSGEWGCEGTWDGCVMDDCGSRVTRCFFDFDDKNKSTELVMSFTGAKNEFH